LRDTSDLCRWLHEQLDTLPPPIRYPFDTEDLPENGIYFFYEDGEFWGHGGEKLRVVRIGTARDGNFRSRIKEHFLLNHELRVLADAMEAGPKDRSIFRKNIGRVLLNKKHDPYLAVWEKDMTITKNKLRYAGERDMQKEMALEQEVTAILRGMFSFRYILVQGEMDRMGSAGLEGRSIGTVARCSICQASPVWLGRHSPVPKISDGRLWLVQHLKSPPLGNQDIRAFSTAIAKTKSWSTGKS